MNTASNKKILVVGADGEIGSALIERLQSENKNFSGTTRHRDRCRDNISFLDLSDPNPQIELAGVSHVVLCASITNIDDCDSNPELAERINYTNTVKIIEECIKAGLFVVFLSSNAVFDGSSPFQKYDDQPRPITNYGELKLRVEQHINAMKTDRACVLRLTKVISENNKLKNNWDNLLQMGRPIECYTNYLISPVHINEVIDSIILLFDRELNGTFHLGGSRELSFYEYAKQSFLAEKDIEHLIIKKLYRNNPNVIYHNSLETYLPTKEYQYQILLKSPKLSMGYMSSHAYLNDPKRLAFTLSRYKFVSKMFSGFNKVLEVGCADAFATPIVAQEVGRLVACDFDLDFISDNKSNHSYRGKIEFVYHDQVRAPFDEKFDGIFALDVFEHIPPSDEDRFLNNISENLYDDGVCIIGMPSLESQIYASEISKAGHVNCKSGSELKRILLNRFSRVFIFSMNDEVLHTGYLPMSQYLFAVCSNPKSNVDIRY